MSDPSGDPGSTESEDASQPGSGPDAVVDDTNQPTDGSDAIADGSFSGEHAAFENQPLLVGPATEDQKNAWRPILTPIACWRLDDIRFDFDSTFVVPQSKPDFAALGVILRKHPGSPISIFGHADPVGSDAYNKQLSGRRAIAIYGALTRNTALWKKLYSASGNGWGNSQVLSMLSALSYAPAQDDGLTTSSASDSLQRFQSDNGLTGHGYVNAATLDKLFLAYMDFLCGPSLSLKKTDFLAQGADPDGRGDYQGCGEFNPLMLFAKDQLDYLSKPENKVQRNAANAVNRRVLVFLFRAGTQVTPSLWPCPKADTDQIQMCEKRFWADGRQRLKNTDQRRTNSADHNTFACRFYDRLSNGSPCDRSREQWVLRILVAGKGPLQGRKALANEPYTLTGNGSGSVLSGRTDINGVLRAAVDDDVCTMLLTIAGMKIVVEGGALHPTSDPNAWKERLFNLGYGDRDFSSWTDDTYTAALKAFQHDEKLEETGTADDETTQKIKELHGS